MATTRFMEGEISPEKGANNGPAEHCDRVRPHQLPHEGHAAILQHPHDVLPHQVQVLLAHVGHLVLDSARIVADDERRLTPRRHFVPVIVLVDRVELLYERFVRCTGKAKQKSLSYKKYNF